MKPIIAYKGKSGVALGLMLGEYVPLFTPWINWRLGIEGTLQRPPYSEAQGLEWVRGLDKTKGANEVFSILTSQSTESEPVYKYVGHTGIHNIEWPQGTGSTGSMIGDTTLQGKGLGTEAKLLLLYHAFMVLGLRKLTSVVKSFNAQSAGHLMKCGYTFVGRYRKQHFHEGRFIDDLLFEVFREDWEPTWGEYQRTGALPRLTDKQRAFLTEVTAS